MSLKECRVFKGLTQQEIADAIGIHVQYYSAIERGARRPGMEVAIRLRDFFCGQVTLDAMVPPVEQAA